MFATILVSAVLSILRVRKSLASAYDYDRDLARDLVLTIVLFTAAAALIAVAGGHWIFVAVPTIVVISRMVGCAMLWHESHFGYNTFFGHESLTAAWYAAGLPVLVIPSETTIICRLK